VIYLVALLIACSIGLLTLAVAQLVPARSAAVDQRLVELQQISSGKLGKSGRSRRDSQREQWRKLIHDLGEKVGESRNDRSTTRQLLVQAGFRGSDAVSSYWGIRTILPIGGLVAGLALAPFLGPSALLMGFAFGGIAWIAPAFYLGRRIKRRKKELQKALPDALDSMVVCVEAGLGLNQAIVRVSDEIRHISELMSQELALVNFEIRAGTPREDALRNLGERTGLEDIRSLVAMLIQTDRFGTSVAQALRVQSDTLRTKRRQRAEEAAAKTAIKMLFPLVFFILPALFVVVLGPGMIQLLEVLGSVDFQGTGDL
jgi:tight adherence protein C